MGGERRLDELVRQLNEPVSPFLARQPVDEGGGRRKWFVAGWQGFSESRCTDADEDSGEVPLGSKSLLKFMLQSKPLSRRITECASNWKGESFR